MAKMTIFKRDICVSQFDHQINETLGSKDMEISGNFKLKEPKASVRVRTCL